MFGLRSPPGRLAMLGAGLLVTIAYSTTACGPDPGVCKPSACTSLRWIGIRKAPSGSCPTPVSASWTVQPLFPPTGVPPQSPETIARYCLYTWTAGQTSARRGDCPEYGPVGPSASDVDLLSTTPGLKDVAADCEVVTPSSFPDDLRKWQHDQVVARAGGLSSLPPLTPTATGLVRQHQTAVVPAPPAAFD